VCGRVDVVGAEFEITANSIRFSQCFLGEVWFVFAKIERAVSLSCAEGDVLCGVPWWVCQHTAVWFSVSDTAEAGPTVLEWLVDNFNSSKSSKQI